MKKMATEETKKAARVGAYRFLILSRPKSYAMKVREKIVSIRSAPIR